MSTETETTQTNKKRFFIIICSVAALLAVVASGLGYGLLNSQDNPIETAAIEGYPPMPEPAAGTEEPFDSDGDETVGNTSPQPEKKTSETQQAESVDSDKDASFTDQSPRHYGNPDAPVRIIEYASLSCGHCGSFHTHIFPKLKSKYIDTGKVFFEYRDFPTNKPALIAAMTSYCLPEERQRQFTNLLFSTQETWLSKDEAFYMNYIRQNAKLLGLDDQGFEDCLEDEELKKKVSESAAEGQSQWNVQSTPTFIINETETLVGAQPLYEFERVFRKVTNGEIGKIEEVE